MTLHDDLKKSTKTRRSHDTSWQSTKIQASSQYLETLTLTDTSTQHIWNQSKVLSSTLQFVFAAARILVTVALTQRRKLDDHYSKVVVIILLDRLFHTRSCVMNDFFRFARVAVVRYSPLRRHGNDDNLLHNVPQDSFLTDDLEYFNDLFNNLRTLSCSHDLFINQIKNLFLKFSCDEFDYVSLLGTKYIHNLFNGPLDSFLIRQSRRSAPRSSWRLMKRSSKICSTIMRLIEKQY